MEKIICQNMSYAPVLITTCNRYEHLKKTIEGLVQCTYANKTDLYISVDFPPSDKYLDGYNHVKEFLKEEIIGFNSVTVFYQEKNLGAFENESFLFEMAREKGYKFAICLEDDTIAKPALLDFMNKCFEYYKEDDNIVGVHVHGADIKPNDVKYNAVYAHYGAYNGFFIDKRAHIEKTVDQLYLLDILLDKKKRNKLKCISKNIVSHCVIIALGLEPKLMNKDGTVAVIDYVFNIYCWMENQYGIASVQGLTVNNGLDGTGLHAGDEPICPPFGYYDESEIEVTVQDKEFCFNREIEIHSREQVDTKYYIKCCICVFFLRVFGENASKKIWNVMEYFSKVRPRISKRK